MKTRTLLQTASPIEVRGAMDPRFQEILTADALNFVASLVNNFSPRLKLLLQTRSWISQRIRSGVLPDFPPVTEDIRKNSWKITSIPADLERRRVEITGPVERKMMINALNSGADVYMADFEDSHSPTWKGTIQGQVNLKDAVEGRLEYTSPEGKKYRLKENLATLCVRPRGLHLPEKHLLVNGEPAPAAMFDFGLYLYHNADRLIQKGTGPYFYLPKLENHLEAQLWNDIFRFSEDTLRIPRGTIKCSVLVENILAAFEMDEILYELKDHVTALNFGRWDYIFSFIKKLGWSPQFLFPDRSQLTMNAHFLKSCALLLVQTCHRRNAYAIGGMAAQVPIRNNPEAQAKALEKVISDKQREVEQGFDGAWVAHPDLVPIVMKVFSEHMPGANQLHVRHENLKITTQDLLSVPEGKLTEEGLRSNINVSLRYLESWLRGTGCVAINNLMEDTATVEISRALVWQWIRQKASLSNGSRITEELFQTVLEQEQARIEEGVLGNSEPGKLELAAETLRHLVTGKDFADFMTTACYDYLESGTET